MYEHILVPLDGSELAESVLPHVKALAEKFGSKVTLLRAVTSAESFAIASATAPVMGQPILAYPTAGVDPNELADAERSEATEYLKKTAEGLGGGKGEVSTVEPEAPAADAIVEYAKAQGVSLIVMTTHGRGGLGRLIMGSVADDVLRHAPCPLLLVRIHEQREQGSNS